jgi:hypothetical protein
MEKVRLIWVGVLHIGEVKKVLEWYWELSPPHSQGKQLCTGLENNALPLEAEYEKEDPRKVPVGKTNGLKVSDYGKNNTKKGVCNFKKQFKKT